MKNRLLSTLLFLFMTPVITLSASFDCSKASNKTERLICSNNEIGFLDEVLAGKYKKALSLISKSEQKELRNSQRKWLKKRKKYCDTVSSCINEFSDRIDFLERFISNPLTKKIILKKWEKYSVPNGKKWIIKEIKPADCKVCTSDIYLNGGMAVGEPNGFTLYGKYDISFVLKSHPVIHLFSGTTISTGDTRGIIIVEERNE